MKRLVSLLLTIALLTACLSAFAQEVAVDTVLDPEMVRMLQIDLIGKGYLSEEEKADGVLGSATQEAIRKAQEALNQEVNGLMTDELIAALRADPFPLQMGMRSSYVYALQDVLYRWGYLESAPTGYFGSATADAAASFQSAALEQFVAERQAEADAALASLEVADDVVVDRPIISAENIPCDGVFTQEWFDFLNKYEFPIIIASPGDNNTSVKLLQKRLHALGYLYTGMSGNFGDVTTLALKYFQYKNGLPESGSCDQATSAALFGEDAVQSDEYVMPYMAYVNRASSRVYIYGWDGRGYNTKAKAFKCSCGAKKTPTLTGTYYAVGPISEWYYMQASNVWVRYAFQIKGNYFFHSVLFNHKGDKRPTSTSVANLGHNVSHGCIRLAVDDIKWIYQNCTAGMKVVIE